MSSTTAIKTLISQHEELTRLLPLMTGVTIIEYDGDDIQGSTGFYEYMLSVGLSVDVVNRIIVCGKNTEKQEDNLQMLRTLFPFVEPEATHKQWFNTDFASLDICDVLVLHMANGITVGEYDNHRGKGIKLHEVITLTRQAYYACFLSQPAIDYDLFDEPDPNCLKVQLRITDFEVEEGEELPEPTAFCVDKQKYIKMCQDTLIPKDYFFQCVDEADHGCEECNQCGKYGKRKQCPFAQRKIAEFYRKGMYVPKDEKIAHQWEAMAARQGYRPAQIQLADDLYEGKGCNQSLKDALDIYRKYALKNDGYCIHRIIDLAEAGEGMERIAAIPYIAKLAKGGDENMILRLSDAFQNGDYGLPKDIVQQEEWIRQGAENGNPRFVKAMAEMYEANGDWADSYIWYKKLAEVSPEMADEYKIEEVELKMLTNGSSDEDIAWKGMDYLYGYHGIERDTHLAFRCLSYAKEKEIPLAIGLLGQMYLKGIGVEKDESLGASLILSAADKGDLLSKESRIFDLYGSDHVHFNWVVSPMEETSESEMFDYLVGCLLGDIDDELKKNQDNPIAHYLWGTYLGIYSGTDEESFGEMMKAAEMDYPPAQYQLALMYKEGRGTQQDTSLYRKWIETSAKNGHYEAEGVWGVMLYKGWTNYHASFKYLKEAIDQGSEDSEVYWCLTQCLMYGIGTDKNEKMAYPMYIKAAEDGWVDAQVKLCQDYFNGNEFLPKNYKECARWGDAAIAQGKKGVRFETAYSSSHIGNHDRAKELYLELSNEGNGAAMNNYACELSDYEEKAEWFQKAVDAGDSYGMWNLGKYYRDGTGVEKNIEKAIELFTKSANLGCQGAIEDLAWMYRRGIGVDVDGEEAVKWYKLGVDKGYNDHLLELGRIYLDGTLVEKDVELAIHYYKTAAEKGIMKAFLKLGEIFKDGIGVEKDTQKAIYWYRKAATNGNENAKKELKQLGSNWVEDGKVEDGSDDERYDNDNDNDNGIDDDDILPF